MTSGAYSTSDDRLDLINIDSASYTAESQQSDQVFPGIQVFSPLFTAQAERKLKITIRESRKSGQIFNVHAPIWQGLLSLSCTSWTSLWQTNTLSISFILIVKAFRYQSDSPLVKCKRILIWIWDSQISHITRSKRLIYLSSPCSKNALQDQPASASCWWSSSEAGSKRIGRADQKLHSSCYKGCLLSPLVVVARLFPFMAPLLSKLALWTRDKSVVSPSLKISSICLGRQRTLQATWPPSVQYKLCLTCNMYCTAYGNVLHT